MPTSFAHMYEYAKKSKDEIEIYNALRHCILNKVYENSMIDRRCIIFSDGSVFDDSLYSKHNCYKTMDEWLAAAKKSKGPLLPARKKEKKVFKKKKKYFSDYVEDWDYDPFHYDSLWLEAGPFDHLC